MSNVFDVGQLITELIPGVDKMKLYKICFFSQGWHLAWTGRPLFEEQLLAWQKGPVPLDLRRVTEPVSQGWNIPYVPRGNSANLTDYERSVIENIVTFYGSMSSSMLSAVSHGHAWREARRGLPANERSGNPMSITTIREEFTDRLHSGKDTPVAPMMPTEVVDADWDRILAIASAVENDWRHTLALLSNR